MMFNRGEVDDATMFVVFIFLNAIVVGGVLLAMGSFYSNKYDGRMNEAQSLITAVEKCVKVNSVLVNDFNLSKCGLNEKVLSENHLVYITDGSNEFSFGVLDYKNQCFFNGVGDNGAYPVCVKKTFVKEGKSYTVIAGTNQKPGVGP